MDDNIQNWQEATREIFNYVKRLQKAYLLSFSNLFSPEVLEHSAYIGDVYQTFLKNVIENPHNLMQLQQSYWNHCYKLWQKSLDLWSNDSESLNPDLENDDKRFKDRVWKEHPVFNFIKQYYLLTAEYIQATIKTMDGLDENTAKKMIFITRQLLDAWSPTNFIMTNPKVLQTTIKTQGINLLEGFRKMLDDIAQHHGNLQIKMTDLSAFSVGKNLAITPGKIIYQNELMQLIQYNPRTPEVYKKPLLIIPPWINKYYILDLSPENSFVKWVLEQGYTIFMISWVNPDARHAHKDFEDYLFAGPLTAIKIIQQITNGEQINTLGYCLGGTLLACTLAYLAATNDSSIATATYLATLLDFSNPGELGVFIDEKQISLIEKQMWEQGFLDGNIMAMTFNTLRANDLIWSYFVKNYLQAEEPAPLDLLYWNSDVTNMPAQMHSFYLRNFYLNNALIKPEGLKFAGVHLDLKKIKIPAYFVAAQQDHIAPWKSIYEGTSTHLGENQFILTGSGHIAGIVNPPHLNKYHYHLNTKIGQDPDVWLNTAQVYEGSWWPHWELWLRCFSGDKVDARIPGEKTKIIEDAPGSYVKKTHA